MSNDPFDPGFLFWDPPSAPTFKPSNSPRLPPRPVPVPDPDVDLTPPAEPIVISNSSDTKLGDKEAAASNGTKEEGKSVADVDSSSSSPFSPLPSPAPSPITTPPIPSNSAPNNKEVSESGITNANDATEGVKEAAPARKDSLEPEPFPTALPTASLSEPNVSSSKREIKDPKPQSAFKAAAVATFNLTDMKNLIPLEDATEDELPSEPSLAMPFKLQPVRTSQMDKYFQLVTDNKLKEAALSLNPTSPRTALKLSEVENGLNETEETSDSASVDENISPRSPRDIKPEPIAPLPKPLSSALPLKTALDPMKSVLKGAKNQTNEVLIRARFALNKRDGNIEEVNLSGDLVEEVRRRVEKLKALSAKWQKTLALFKTHSAQIQRFTEAQQALSETFRSVSHSDSENQTPAYGLSDALNTSRQEGGSYIRAIDRLIERAETFVDKVVTDALESATRYEEQRREYLIAHEKLEKLLQNDTSLASMEKEVELKSKRRQLDRSAHDVCEKLILVHEQHSQQLANDLTNYLATLKMYYSKCHTTFKASRDLKGPEPKLDASANLPKNPNIFDFERFEIVEEEGDNGSTHPSNLDEDSPGRSYRNLYFPEVPQYSEAEGPSLAAKFPFLAAAPSPSSSQNSLDTAIVSPEGDGIDPKRLSFDEAAKDGADSIAPLPSHLLLKGSIPNPLSFQRRLFLGGSGKSSRSTDSDGIGLLPSLDSLSEPDLSEVRIPPPLAPLQPLEPLQSPFSNISPLSTSADFQSLMKQSHSQRRVNSERAPRGNRNPLAARDPSDLPSSPNETPIIPQLGSTNLNPISSYVNPFSLPATTLKSPRSNSNAPLPSQFSRSNPEVSGNQEYDPLDRTKALLASQNQQNPSKASSSPSLSFGFNPFSSISNPGPPPSVPSTEPSLTLNGRNPLLAPPPTSQTQLFEAAVPSPTKTYVNPFSLSSSSPGSAPNYSSFSLPARPPPSPSIPPSATASSPKFLSSSPNLLLTGAESQQQATLYPTSEPSLTASVPAPEPPKPKASLVVPKAYMNPFSLPISEPDLPKPTSSIMPKPEAKPSVESDPSKSSDLPYFKAFPLDSATKSTPVNLKDLSSSISSLLKKPIVPLTTEAPAPVTIAPKHQPKLVVNPYSLTIVTEKEKDQEKAKAIEKELATKEKEKLEAIEKEKEPAKEKEKLEAKEKEKPNESEKTAHTKEKEKVVLPPAPNLHSSDLKVPTTLSGPQTSAAHLKPMIPIDTKPFDNPFALPLRTSSQSRIEATSKANVTAPPPKVYKVALNPYSLTAAPPTTSTPAPTIPSPSPPPMVLPKLDPASSLDTSLTGILKSEVNPLSSPTTLPPSVTSDHEVLNASNATKVPEMTSTPSITSKSYVNPFSIPTAPLSTPSATKEGPRVLAPKSYVNPLALPSATTIVSNPPSSSSLNVSLPKVEASVPSPALPNSPIPSPEPSTPSFSFKPLPLKSSSISPSAPPISTTKSNSSTSSSSSKPLLDLSGSSGPIFKAKGADPKK